MVPSFRKGPTRCIVSIATYGVYMLISRNQTTFSFQYIGARKNPKLYNKAVCKAIRETDYIYVFIR